MKARITAVALCLCVMAGTPAHAAHDGPVSQPKAGFTVQQYKRYASKAYRREIISRRARRKLRTMVLHQRAPRGKKRVIALRAKYLRLHRSLLCSNYNPLPCIYMAANRFHVAASWLISCARSEGGLGSSDYRKFNYGGSGAAGNFQFMYSTFVAAIRRMGEWPKPWLSSRWQAMAAAFKFAHGESGEWTGAGC